jgi:excisionase family DNA binding protein
MAPQNPELPRLLTAAELASVLGVPRWRLYELTRAGLLPHIRLGRAVRYDPERVNAWLHDGGTAAS